MSDAPSALITAIGEILVDFTPVVEGGRTVGFRMHPGGSPYNVAVGVARLGGRAEFAGKVSTDVFGRFLEAHLEREGVGRRFLARADAPTTLAFVTVEHGEPHFSFYGTGTADTLLRPEDLSAGITETQVLHFGSISLLREPTAGTVMTLVERLRGRALLSFDPNIRPGLITDQHAYRTVLEGLTRTADLLKVSATDLRWLDADRGVEEAAAGLLPLGPALVAVTLGAQGGYAVARSGAVRVPAPTVAVVDTVGAGDAFTAALLVGLTERGIRSRRDLAGVDQGTLEGVLRLAVTAAALTCTRAGADPPRRDELEAAV